MINTYYKEKRKYNESPGAGWSLFAFGIPFETETV